MPAALSLFPIPRASRNRTPRIPSAKGGEGRGLTNNRNAASLAGRPGTTCTRVLWTRVCPRCGSKMHRSRALIERHELVRLLKNLAIGSYPVRPPPADVPETAPVTYGAVGRRTRPSPQERISDANPPEHEEVSQIPADWDDWPAAG